MHYLSLFQALFVTIDHYWSLFRVKYDSIIMFLRYSKATQAVGGVLLQMRHLRACGWLPVVLELARSPVGSKAEIVKHMEHM